MFVYLHCDAHTLNAEKPALRDYARYRQEIHSMNPCIFLAGATGAIGRRLAPLLIAAGYRVAGSTRAGEKAAGLREIGVEPIVVDVFDVDALCQAMSLVQPSVVIHQLTDLPPGLDMSKMDAAVVRNARIREVGTRNLVAAALHAGAQRLIAQSVAFAYADGALPYDETAPLNLDGEGNRGISARGVASLEQQVLTAPLDGAQAPASRLPPELGRCMSMQLQRQPNSRYPGACPASTILPRMTGRLPVIKQCGCWAGTLLGGLDYERGDYIGRIGRRAAFCGYGGGCCRLL